MKLVDKVLRIGEGRKLKSMEAVVGLVNAHEAEMQALSDEALAAKTVEFRGRLTNGELLDDLLPEAFAAVREAAWRSVGMRPFDVQVLGGIVLHHGNIAEMKTGEGKTLVATMPVYLNALPGGGVHVVTVNDYLAGRDAEWMGPVYRFMGLSVAAVQNSMRPAERREAYASDVAYGTNTEFGFDYLRDNMALSLDEEVQRGYAFCIVDEVDSILIDEARTPLIISGPGERAAQTYYDFARIGKQLKAFFVKPGEVRRSDDPDAGVGYDYEVDEKKKTIAVTEEGLARVEKLLGLENIYEDLSGQLVNHLNQALRAQALFKSDVDYLVTDGEVKIIDEFTGRVLEGRRYSEGLHQAIEAKEGVRIREENQTLATITLQNYFRLYEKIAGMTGTAATEADEFRQIYGMDVLVIPPNRPMIRDDRDDLIYKSEAGKFQAVVEDLRECYERGQPVLVGTISVEKSERLSAMLSRRGVPHEVLNAKHHAREATIVENAGEKGSITIATNMAGRGTDIKLGEGVVDRGGLYVLGTERHESRRIDNQLRGRSGRQGDPGVSRFYISLEDDLMRLFSGERIHGLMDRLGIEEDMPIEHKLISRSVESAQKRVEEQNFQIRKRVLEYDDVMNKQREVVYAQRHRILRGEDLGEDVLEIIQRVVAGKVQELLAESRYAEDWDLEELLTQVRTYYPSELAIEDLGDPEELDVEEVAELISDDAIAAYRRKEQQVGSDALRELERWVLLRTMDAKWRDHLYEMDYLREGIGLRALAQRDPLVEYKTEGFDMFQAMMQSVQEDFVRYVFHLEVVQQTEEPRREEGGPQLVYSGAGIAPAQGASKRIARGKGTGAAGSAGMAMGGGIAADPSRAAFEQAQAAGRTVVAPRHVEKVGRNDPCPCGSGKKYKKCHGA
jgi:preprotein translocase subunit SecA